MKDWAKLGAQVHFSKLPEFGSHGKKLRYQLGMGNSNLDIYINLYIVFCGGKEEDEDALGRF